MPLQVAQDRPAQDLPVVCLMGPTASGKTALACELYSLGHFELVSVDSALIYRDMNIGTAKPSAAELDLYPHHLIDIINPTEVYSAAQFVEEASRLIDSIHLRGKIPLLVGGTMLYFRSLLSGMADYLPAACPAVREAIAQQAAANGWQAVYDELSRVDPQAARRFKPSDRQRIVRALEVYRLTGRAISDLHAAQSLKPNSRYRFELYALIPDRALLHQRIEQRLQHMWDLGFVDEVIQLRYKYPLHADLPSMRTVGYRQVWEFLQYEAIHGTATPHHIQLMQNKALFATRQLAKRQYTWLRSLRELHAFNIYNTLNEGILDLRIRYR